MRPLTDALPKELLPLGRRTALQHIVYELAYAGIERIVFVVSPTKEAMMRSALGEGADALGIRFAYAVQPAMRGLGDALLYGADLLDEEAPVLVALGDAVIAEPESGGLVRRLLTETGANEQSIGLVVQRVPRERLSRYGIVRPVHTAPEESGVVFAIDGIVEKPSPEQAPSVFAAAARYRLPYTVFETLRRTPPNAKGEVDLTDALQTLLANGAPGVAVSLADGETRHDIGNFDSYYRAFVAFALADRETGGSLRRDLEKIMDHHKEPTLE